MAGRSFWRLYSPSSQAAAVIGRSSQVLQGKTCTSQVYNSNAFEQALAKERLILVAGYGTAGRSSVAAATAIALARQRSTILVDADDPVHGIEDIMGIEFGEDAQVSSSQGASWTQPMQLDSDGALSASKLSALGTRNFLEKLLAADAWRRLLEDSSGASVVAAMGISVRDLVGILECVRPPPGAEMPVALARFLHKKTDKKWDYVVVDAGVPALAAQLQSVPPVVAGGLEGLLNLQRIIKIARNNVMPSAIISGLKVLAGSQTRRSWSGQISQVVHGLEELRLAMASLASMKKTFLLVLPYHACSAEQKGACRIIERLKPTCIALTGYDESTAHLAPRPSWLPDGVPVITLPWAEEGRMQKPVGGEELVPLADAMLNSRLAQGGA